jgi:hypothetical protein
MTPAERLDRILGSRLIYAFPPFGVDRASVSFSESPPEHLRHLIANRGFPPWGLVVTRRHMLKNGGGAVAYLPQQAYEDLPASVRHWAVQVRTDGTFGDWTHEREWRLPMPEGKKKLRFVNDTTLRAVLIGDPAWRPRPIATTWVDESNGTTHPGPVTPHCREQHELPPLWMSAEIWQWDRDARAIVKRAAGSLT